MNQVDLEICPGCLRETTEFGVLGLHWDNKGRYQGTYILCIGCADLIRKGDATVIEENVADTFRALAQAREVSH